MIVRVVNPGTPPLKKKRRAKTKSKTKGPITMARRRGKRRRHSAKRHHKNPFYKKHRRNPESAGSMDPTRGNNIVMMLAGTAGGAIVPKIVANMTGFVGNAKYAMQAGVGIGGYFLLKKINPKLALTFLIASIAVAIRDASQDYGIMQGVENGARTLLGMTPSFTPIQNRNFRSFADNLRNARQLSGGIVATGQNGMDGIVASGQPFLGIVPTHPEQFAGYEGTTY